MRTLVSQRLDVWYVDNWTLALDVKILLRTVATIVSRRGISAGGHPTMPSFGGTVRDQAGPGRALFPIAFADPPT